MSPRRDARAPQPVRTVQLQLEQLENRNLPTSSSSPNIVLIMTDDQRFDSMSYMPLTRAIFASGTMIDNAFVTTPVCCPSRVSTLTGEYARHHGVHGNGGSREFDEKDSLATWLDAEGYLTFFAGKYMNGYQGKRIPPGWDDWHAFKAGSITARHGSGYFGYALNNNGKLNRYGTGEEDYSTDVLRDHSIFFVTQTAETEDDTPFFMVFSPRAPHGIPQPAPRHASVPIELNYTGSYNEEDMHDKPRQVRRADAWGPRKRAARQRFHENQVRTLLAVDEAVYGIYAAVVAAGELSRTLFLYTSDNGYMWGEHRLNGKQRAYEESIRVPLLVRQGWADTVPVLQQFVLNIDLAPTILDYAGVAIPDSVDGQSFRPLLEGGTAWRSDFLIEHWGPTWKGLRGEGFVYIVHEHGYEEYYDLLSDPFELENVANNSSYLIPLWAARIRLKELEAEIG